MKNIIVIILIIVTFASCGKLQKVDDIIDRGYLRVEWLGMDSTYYYTSDVKTIDPDTLDDAVLVRGILLYAATRNHGYMSEKDDVYIKWEADSSNITFGD